MFCEQWIRDISCALLVKDPTVTVYILLGVVVVLVLVSALCLNIVWKAVKINDSAEKQRHYLLRALKARGLWDDYQLAMRDAWELWGRDERAGR
ncbi:hypothetical protein M2401_003688 [Pseudomonas sp. JUb42]|nr:hypothetical protein [Pseudomonas sp. JUb42]